MEEKCWVIAGEHGLYVGQWRTRNNAIMKHTADLHSGRDGIPELSEYGSLTDAHREAWARCRKRGDRAIHATIIF